MGRDLNMSTECNSYTWDVMAVNCRQFTLHWKSFAAVICMVNPGKVIRARVRGTYL